MLTRPQPTRCAKVASFACSVAWGMGDTLVTVKGSGGIFGTVVGGPGCGGMFTRLGRSTGGPGCGCGSAATVAGTNKGRGGMGITEGGRAATTGAGLGFSGGT